MQDLIQIRYVLRDKKTTSSWVILINHFRNGYYKTDGIFINTNICNELFNLTFSSGENKYALMSYNRIKHDDENISFMFFLSDMP